jgi:hypothetical protein
MKTGGDLGIPSKISLLKDLAGTFLEGGGLFFEKDAPTQAFSKLSKS